MTDAATEAPETKKRSILPLVIGVGLAAAGAAGGYFAVGLGLLSETNEKPPEVSTAKVAFVPLPSLVVSLGESSGRHLRFEAQLEVRPGTERTVETVLPRIMDILNGYLRAVDVAEIEDPAALIRIRAQMLRRVQIVVGGDAVTDLLIMEFLLN